MPIVLAGVMLAALLGAIPASATYPGDNGRIAFVYYGAGQDNGEVHTINADGTGLRRLSNYDAFGQDNVFDGPPVWSPDGTKLAFRTSGGGYAGITVMNADGTDRHSISVLDAWSPAWSRDSKRITFGAVTQRGLDDYDFDIYIANVDGTGLRNLSQRLDDELDSSWSPDGRIAFESQGSVLGNIWITNSDGTAQTKLEDAGGDGVQWSPDGSKIAYLNADVYTVNPDGSDARNLGQGLLAYDFDWSPDGRKLAFTSYQQGPSEIYSVNADGSELTRLTNLSGFVGSPAWSPDGTKIVFKGNDGLATMNSDGGDFRSLGKNGDFPDWQPLQGPQPSDYKNAAQFCKALRTFLRQAEFSKRYKSHGQCVRSNQ